MNVTYAVVPFALGAAIAGALALIVFYNGPGRIANRALAALLLVAAARQFAYMMSALLGNDTEAVQTSVWTRFGNDIGSAAILLGVPLALSWPAPRAWAPRALASVWPYATLGILLALAEASVRANASRVVAVISPEGALAAIGMLIVGISLGAAYLLVREARREMRADLRDGRVLIALGISLGLINTTSRNVLFLHRHIESGEGAALVGAIASVLLVPLILALLVSIWRIPSKRTARLGGFLIIASFLSGVFDAAAWWTAVGAGVPAGDSFGLRLFLYAVWRLVPAALLAYAVLRGQIPGLDVKVRWGMSRGSVAAAFVAAFFVAGEGAQILFGQGNEWVGLLAAGALVFALAPLQRAAERLAERAVPVAAPSGAAAIRPRGAELYRRSLRFALRDGRIAPEEELHLFEVAEELGLTAGDAMRLRQEVEREVAGGASA